MGDLEAAKLSAGNKNILLTYKARLAYANHQNKIGCQASKYLRHALVLSFVVGHAAVTLARASTVMAELDKQDVMGLFFFIPDIPLCGECSDQETRLPLPALTRTDRPTVHYSGVYCL